MPAADEPSVARLGRRHLDAAALGRARAARMESASGRRIGEVGDFAADRAQRRVAAERNHAFDQTARVRMLRVGEDPLDAAVLDHLPRVHHAHVVGELGDERRNRA